MIVAPAGFGKTVLMTSWLSSASVRPVAWVSLDASDNDPSRFWAYVLAALAGAGLSLSPAEDGPADWAGALSPVQAFAPLVNVLAALTSDLIVVLDDFHLITDPRIHQGIAFLVDQQPPRLHLVILARSDPPFIASRWKANGEMTEIRARDLAFNREETTLLLGVHGVILPAELREALLARLEGWAVAAQLLSLWVARRDDPSAAVAEFAASDATIADYLISEVLAQLPGDLRRFVLWTSILPRLTGPLCDAVIDDGWGAEALQELDRRDLFVHALDPARQWFRYHQLFAEILGHELRRAYPETVCDLHRRASEWFAANGFAGDAIEQSLAAEDWPTVQTLMLGEALSIGSRYPPSVVESWLAALPRAVVETNPLLLVCHAFVLGQLGRLDDARLALGAAQKRMEMPGRDPGLPELGALLQSVAAGIARLDCDLVAVRGFAIAVDHELERAGATNTALAGMAASVARNAMAATLFWHGDVRGAEEALRMVEQDDAYHPLARMRVNGICMRALILATTGHLREAELATAQALELAQPVGVSALFQTNPAHLAIAVVSYQRGDHSRARLHLALVSERARRHRDRAVRLAAGVLLARLSALQGDIAEAFAILDDEKAAWPGWKRPAALQAILCDEEVRICLLGGDLAAARAVSTQLSSLPNEASLIAITKQVVEARLLLADEARSSDQLSLAVEALIGAAMASRSAGHTTDALTCLNSALALAQDETMVGPFVREAASLRPLLLTMELGHGEFTGRGFRQRLLDVMGVPTKFPSDDPSAASIRMLSDRELTVLRLLRGSLTNTEIASALAVSRNTLKTHLKNIYSKLNAQDRALAELEAESVAFIVADGLDMQSDTPRFSNCLGPLPIRQPGPAGDRTPSPPRIASF